MPENPQAVVPPTLKVIDREGFVLGHVPARVGMMTYAGEITRFTSKSIWCLGSNGIVSMYREYDGRLPGVYRSRVRKSEVTWNPK